MRDGSYRDKKKMLIPTWKGVVDDPHRKWGRVGEARILPSALRGCPASRIEGRPRWVVPKCFC